MTDCQLGHAVHEKITVPTRIGPMTVYDTERYETDLPGWCPGRHITCHQLRIEGQWEPHDTEAIRHILENGDRNKWVIDFGAHAGWYTVMAAKYGYRVLAVENEDAHIALLMDNVARHGIGDRVSICQAWVDENFTVDDPGCDVELIKADIEGAEKWAVQACEPWMDQISNWYLEISPEFRDDYPALVDKLKLAGFEAFYPDGRPFDGRFVSQINLRFSR